MPRVLVDCGNCGPDFNSIRQMVKTNFGAIVLQTHGAEDTLELLRKQPVALVTVNRKLDRDYTDGLEVIRRLKADPVASQIPVMLITNYEEHQQQVMAEGAVLGFGKLSLGEESARKRLLPYLKDVAVEARE